MQLPGRDSMGNEPRRQEMDSETNAFPGSESVDDNMDEDVSADMEDDEPVLDEEDLEENDLTEEEADDVEWEEPTRE